MLLGGEHTSVLCVFAALRQECVFLFLLFPEDQDVTSFEHYISVGRERLRCGYTTGTCAAAATRGAAELLLTGSLPDAVIIDTPSGISVEAELLDPAFGPGWASCAVRKDAGDDPDVTNGAVIIARVELSEEKEVVIDGGKGIGRITRPGLDQPVGNAAINSVPRKMIEQQARAALSKHGGKGLRVIISMPDGERLAAKTFNPRLGIEGGVSILGTSGIVRPMSETALVASLLLEIDMLHAAGCQNIIMTPGNYGDHFCTEVLQLPQDFRVSCSNYIGACIDHAAGTGINSILLVGHIGKLIKVAAGSMNTHSRTADGRRETLAAHTAMCGGSQALTREVFGCITVDEALGILERENLLKDVMESVTYALGQQLRYRAGEEMKIEAITFSNKYGVLGKTEGAEALMLSHIERMNK